MEKKEKKEKKEKSWMPHKECFFEKLVQESDDTK